MAEIVAPARAVCAHREAGSTSLRCPDCRGIMRRCCQSALGTKHREGCAEEQWEKPVRLDGPPPGTLEVD